jgi:phage FluMu protein Com
MVVKVISDKPVKSYQIVCPHCDYMLEYVKEDIITTYDADSDAYRNIKCPRSTCGKYVSVPKP